MCTGGPGAYLLLELLALRWAQLVLHGRCLWIVVEFVVTVLQVVLLIRAAWVVQRAMRFRGRIAPSPIYAGGAVGRRGRARGSPRRGERCRRVERGWSRVIASSALRARTDPSLVLFRGA